MPYKSEEDRRAYDRDRKRADRAGQISIVVSVPSPVRMRVIEDVTKLLEHAVELTEGDPDARPIEKARAIASLASVLLRLIEARELAARLDALERMDKERERLRKEGEDERRR
jgi:hypothetical protein